MGVGTRTYLINSYDHVIVIDQEHYFLLGVLEGSLAHTLQETAHCASGQITEIWLTATQESQ